MTATTIARLARWSTLALGLTAGWSCTATVETQEPAQEPAPQESSPPPGAKSCGDHPIVWSEPCAQPGEPCGIAFEMVCPSGSWAGGYTDYECSADHEWVVVSHVDAHCPVECPDDWPAIDSPCPEVGLSCWYTMNEPCPDGGTSAADFLYGCSTNGWYEIEHYDPQC